jgi:hypothetical protein
LNLIASSASVASNRTVNVFTGAADTFVIWWRTIEESMPPERKMPIGLSAIM